MFKTSYIHGVGVQHEHFHLGTKWLGIVPEQILEGISNFLYLGCNIIMLCRFYHTTYQFLLLVLI